MATQQGYRTFAYGPAYVRDSRIRVADVDFRSPSTTSDDQVMAVYGQDDANHIHDVTFENCAFQSANSDDSFTVIQNTRGVLCVNCDFTFAPAAENTTSCKAFTVGANIGYPDMNVANWIECRECRFNAFLRAPDVYGGVVTFIDCVFEPSARNTLTRARCNFIRCVFRTSLKPSWATFWDSTTVLVRPLMLDTPGEASIYVEACKLNGSVVTGSQLCRSKFPPGGSADWDGDVPASVFATGRVGPA